MSLKAKIEAVIYASEEPVTLAQLVSLLGNEAQAELDRAAAFQTSLPLEDALDLATEPEDPEDTDPDGLQPAPQLIAPDAAVDPPGADLVATLDERNAVRDQRLRAQRLRDHFRSLLDQLVADYATPDRGLEVREVAGGYRLSTKPEYHDAVRGFVKLLKPPLRLTLQALETLAVVAYKQPVTAPEISEIRGVDSGGVLGSLMARKLITTAGRKQVIGRPILYKTTRDFLLRFGLRDVAELPSIEEFEKMAGELADFDQDSQEEMLMPPHDPARLTTAELEAELNPTEPQADGDSTEVDTLIDSADPDATDDPARIDAEPVDGRVAGPPPSYDTTNNPDSPEGDAFIQNEAASEGHR